MFKVFLRLSRTTIHCNNADSTAKLKGWCSYSQIKQFNTFTIFNITSKLKALCSYSRIKSLKSLINLDSTAKINCVCSYNQIKHIKTSSFVSYKVGTKLEMSGEVSDKNDHLESMTNSIDNEFNLQSSLNNTVKSINHSSVSIETSMEVNVSNHMNDRSTISNSINTDSALSTENRNKRTNDEMDAHEKYVKRILLDPVPCPKDITSNAISSRKAKKYVLLLAYSGKGYLGMQRNPGCSTIEEDLFDAMLKADLVDAAFIKCPQSLWFQRAARTDKGVSAAHQIVSLKLKTKENDSDICSMINQYLPAQIKVMKVVKVTKHFDAKSNCDSRSYSYLTPSFSFAPPESFINEEYRISEKVLADVRELLDSYKGTKNFHNFTCRVKFDDKCANRYIIDTSCSDPFIKNGIEWVHLKVKGQSFMMHQIRKMIGLCMAISRGLADKDIFKLVFTKEHVDIPKAPGLGLVLEEPHYDYYNKKFGNDGIHEALKWNSIKEEIETFRNEFIDNDIMNSEKCDKISFNWLSTLPMHYMLNANKVREGTAEEEPSNEILNFQPTDEKVHVTVNKGDNDSEINQTTKEIIESENAEVQSC